MAIKMKIKDNKDTLITKPPKIEILKLSASSMKTYEQCPKKYFYNYIDKQPRKNWPHFDLGNLCHKTLEIFHQIYMEEGADLRTLSKIMAFSFSEARKEFLNMNSELIAEAKTLVGKYLTKVAKDGMPHVKGIETEFNFKLNKNLLIRGYLDRIDIMNDGKFHIVDYKTTKNTKYLDEFQLLLYGLWLKNEYPHVTEFKGSYVLLRHNSKYKSYEFNSEDLERCTKKVISYGEQIVTSIDKKSWRPIPTRLCNWCDFKDICETQQGWQ